MCGVALGEGKDSFEAIPEVPTGSTMGDQAWDAEVPELPQATCLVEVLKECERAVAGEEIYQVLAEREPVGGGRAEEGEVAAAPWDTTVLCARAPLDVGGGIEVEGL